MYLDRTVVFIHHCHVGWIGGVHQDRAVELVHFPAGVVHGECEWCRRSHAHKVRRKSEVFCVDRHGLHRSITGEEGGDDEAEDRDPRGPR